MNVKPIALVGVVFGTAIKLWLLLAAGLFVYDMIQLKKEESNGRKRTT